MARLRVAAAQLESRRRRPRRQRGADPRGVRGGRRRGLRPRRVPRARRSPATRPRTSCCARRSWRRRPRRSRRWRPAPGARGRGDRLPRGRPRPLQRRGRLRGRQGPGRLPQAAAARTTPCSTSSATSSRAPVDGPLFVVGGVRVGDLDLRGRVEPDRPDRSPRPRAAPSSIVNVNASPYYAGRLARARDDARDARRRRVGARSSTSTSSAVRTSSSSTARRCVFDESGQLVARAKQFAEDLLVVDVDVRPAFRRRLSTRAARARSRRSPRSRSASRRSTVASQRPDRAAPDARARGLRGAGARHARLRAQERLHRRADRPLGRHRLVARRRDRGRRARRRARAPACCMPSRYSSEGSVTDADALAAQPRASARCTVPIEPAHAAFIDMLAPSRSPARTPGLAEENLQARDPRQRRS